MMTTFQEELESDIRRQMTRRQQRERQQEDAALYFDYTQDVLPEDERVQPRRVVRQPYEYEYFW